MQPVWIAIAAVILMALLAGLGVLPFVLIAAIVVVGILVLIRSAGGRRIAP